jgi:hypothetical protein
MYFLVIGRKNYIKSRIEVQYSTEKSIQSACLYRKSYGRIYQLSHSECFRTSCYGRLHKMKHSNVNMKKLAKKKIVWNKNIHFLGIRLIFSVSGSWNHSTTFNIVS